jgi:hypothetical protein
MRQCHLERHLPDCVVHYTTWIPATKARKGKQVKINGEQWVVTIVGAEKDANEVVSDSNDHKRHRKATDI